MPLVSGDTRHECMSILYGVADIPAKKEYLGHTVNFKSHKKSYKSKKTIKNDPSEWQVFENTHDAIIDVETFKTVQRIKMTDARFQDLEKWVFFPE